MLTISAMARWRDGVSGPVGRAGTHRHHERRWRWCVAHDARGAACGWAASAPGARVAGSAQRVCPGLHGHCRHHARKARVFKARVFDGQCAGDAAGDGHWPGAVAGTDLKGRETACETTAGSLSGTATCCQMGLPRLRSRRVSVCKDWGAPNTMRAKSGWRGLMRMLRSAGTTALGTLNSAVWAPCSHACPMD